MSLLTGYIKILKNGRETFYSYLTANGNICLRRKCCIGTLVFIYCTWRESTSQAIYYLDHG